MFLLNTTDVWVYKFDFVFTIQNVSIKSDHLLKINMAKENLQYKMFLLNFYSYDYNQVYF